MIILKEILGTIPTPKDIWSTIKSHFNNLHEFGKLILLAVFPTLEEPLWNIFYNTFLSELETDPSVGNSLYTLWALISLYFGLGVILFAFPHFYENMKINPYFKPLVILGLFIGLSVFFCFFNYWWLLVLSFTLYILRPLTVYFPNVVISLTTILLSYIITCATLGLIFKLLRFQSPKKVIATIIVLIIYLFTGLTVTTIYNKSRISLSRPDIQSVTVVKVVTPDNTSEH